ncbi:relaxase/mobilization nuclease domain-containing protein [Oscillibacter sp. MSJ-31]|nr:relaxase/mobilization nuclease domain-containing protein [Oscillibacter sp. MSJ-31]
MATFKHISSKNADYGAAEAYLTFEHDEFTMKPTLDENGRLIPREDYRISSLNCGGEDFAVACMRANLRYEKNQKREDVKSHHYIISFDPRDGTDNGLTVDRAQELGEQFCKEHFPGHQALVCTHPDGHNHSGNIHVHIVINSLRIYEVPLLPYMDRPADTREGCKHRCTNAAMEYFKSEVMEMCHREGLYQIDLLSGSKERITEREYWAAKKGQLALDKENAVREAAGQPTKPTKFETDKAKLRRTIRQALSQAGSFDEFSSLLLREGVTVKESRGRLSYLTPDRTKPITARKLGDDFDKAAVLVLLTQNAHRAAEQSKAILEYPAAVKKLSQGEKTTKTTPADNTLQRMVDREAKRAEGKGVGYDRWAAKHNLKQMAATVTAYQQYGFSSPEELDEACSAAYMQRCFDALRDQQKQAQQNSQNQQPSGSGGSQPQQGQQQQNAGSPGQGAQEALQAIRAALQAQVPNLPLNPTGKNTPAATTQAFVPNQQQQEALKEEVQKVLAEETARIAAHVTHGIDSEGDGEITTNTEYAGNGYQHAASDIERVLEEMAEGIVHEAMEEELSEELQREANTISYGNAHRGINVTVNRMSQVDPDLVDDYNAVAPELLRLSKRLQKSVSAALRDKRQGGKQTGLLAGKRLNQHALYRDDGRLFYNTRLPMDPINLAVGLLIDESGSMGGSDRITKARATAIVVQDFCEKLGIPIEIIGHTASCCHVELFSYASFDSVDRKDRYRLMDMSARSCNRDGAALRFAAEKLYRYPADAKMLILISDGQPNDHG